MDIRSKDIFRMTCRTTAVLLMLSVCNAAFATVAVKVFSKDEGMSEGNISKPRIYVQNTGTETINNFTYRYFFTTENSKSPMVEPYYLTDKEQIMLVPYGSGYYIQYTVTSANLTPGGLMPHSSGNCVGLHYNDWLAWTKTNDFSNNLSLSFAENQNISVYIGGTRIYGNEPDGGGGGGESGYVLREVWTGITGTSTDSIKVNTTPNFIGPLSTLDEPRQYADNFGSRIRGYITAPTSGSYTFWIASDDDSKFFLSTDTNPANKGTAIASVTGYTSYLQWNKYTSQKSAVKTLVAGTKYYIEVLHKDATQDDNCSVGWLKPGQSGSVPSEIVPSSVLSPYVPPVAPAAPTNLTATTVSSSRIDIAWTDASNNECGFSISMACGSGGFSELAVVSANQTSYQVTGLSSETTYKFKIRAYNTFGNSDYANTAQATTFAVALGGATRELWMGCAGTQVSDIPVSTTPYDIKVIDSLECTQQAADYFGRRIRGYIIPPTTGNYTFWIASDDCSQLWLSTNDQSSSKVLIAFVSGYAGYREWNKYSSQKSSVKALTAGVRYYVEVLHKENNQYDNLSVGWLKPSQSGSVPSQIVPNSALSPFIIPSIPSAPSALTATPISATQIDITWTDNSNNESGFRIERAPAGGSFVQIGTAAANSSIYHDAGLIALTQYQYRIRSYNDLGNSSYSNTATALTLQQAPSVPPVVGLCSFAVFSLDKTTLKDHCYFNGGGAVGSNTAVEMFPQSIVNGSVVSGGNITLKSQAVVNGNVTAAGTVTLESGAAVNNGIVEQGATVATITIPSIATIPTGSQAITVNCGQNLPLAPGQYGALTVITGGTLTLSAGLYTFTSFFLQPEAHVVLNVVFSDMIDIEIAGDLEFSDRSTVLFASSGYVPFIRFYTNDNNTVRIGCDVKLTGMLSAPNGNIAMYSRAQCNGALYGKTITVEPDAVIASDMVNPNEDSDGDGVPNLIEVIMGTVPTDSTSFELIAIPSKALIDNSVDDTVYYDFSKFYPEFPEAKHVPVIYPAHSLTREYLPLIIQAKNRPSNERMFIDSTTYVQEGRYFDFTDDNFIVSGKEVAMALPVSENLDQTDISAMQNSSTDPTQYEAVTSDYIVVDNLVWTVVKKTMPIILVKQPSWKQTVYFDDGTVYSNQAIGKLNYSCAIPIVRPSGTESGQITINYTDYGVSGTPVTQNISKNFSTSTILTWPVRVNLLNASGHVASRGPIMVNSVSVTLSTLANPVTLSSDVYTMYPGRALSITVKCLPQDLASVASGKKLNENQLSFSSTGNLMFESADMGGEGRIKFDASAPTISYTYDYLLKDHLGSTRMVIADNGTATEAIMYQAYGTMSDPLSLGTPELAAREKFTTKEFDQEGGTGTGTDGMRLNYFGARYYDPEIGVWTSTDPQEQDWNAYGYCGGNPIVYVDPDGKWVETVIGMAIGAYIGGVAGNNGELNPTKWENQQAWMIGAVGGAALGGGLEIANNYGLFEGFGKNIVFKGNIFDKMSNMFWLKMLQISSNTARLMIEAIQKSDEILTFEPQWQQELPFIGGQARGNQYITETNTIKINPKSTLNPNEYQLGHGGAWEWETGPYDRRTSIAAELPHAYHDIVEKNIMHKTWREEYRTTGIFEYQRLQYTENTMRAEMGLPYRYQYLRKSISPGGIKEFFSQ